MDTGDLTSDLLIRTTLRGFELEFHTTYGLFSPRTIDEGSKMLLDNLEVAADAHCLDVGCGYGALGVTLGKLAPKGKTIMVDKDFVAVEYANRNVEHNAVPNATAYLSNGLSNVPNDEKFDLIVSNLPAKSGNEMWQIIFRDAYRHLKPGGSIVVVTISVLRKFVKRNFEELFGNYDKVKQGKTYTVSMAEKVTEYLNNND